MANVDTDLEEVMANLGEFGKYQSRQFILHILGGFTAGLHMMTLLTVAAVPPHECVLPENFTGILQAIDSCHYLNEKNETQDCTAWTYDTTYYQTSRAIEWNFVCSRRWMGAVAQSSYMLGVFLGAVTLGSMADKYGRKIIFYGSAVAQLILGVSVAFVPEYYTFLLFRFMYGIVGSAGAYITGFVLTMELVGPSKRTVCGMIFQLAFATGFMIVAAWGSVIKDRFWLQIIYGMHSCLLLGHWWFMDESPRWLWAQGRITESLTIVQRALSINGSQVQLDVKRYTSRGKENRTDSKEKSFSALDLLKTPNLRKKTLNVCLNWFANSIAYYGLSLNMGNLLGNPFLMMFLNGMVEVPSYIFLCLVMDRTGRRSLISTLMLIGGICCILATALPNNFTGAAATTAGIVLFGKTCIAGSFAIIYNYTAELFPTVLRNTALGIGSMCARLSGALTPLVILLDSFNPKVPAIVFGCIAFVAGFLSMYLPETANQPMPETLEDGENFGKGDTCFTFCFSNQKNNDKQNKGPYEVALQQIDDFGNQKESTKS